MLKRIIYKALHRASGRVYIGATTKDLEDRIEDHIQKANKGIGSYFQEAIGTYGPEAFTWEQIDTANSLNELADKEQEYILKYDALENGFNQDSGGGFKKKVYQYDIDTIAILAEYDSLEEAGNSVDAHKNCIAKACSGENRTCKGYYWSYKGPEHFVPPVEGRRKLVIQIDLEGNILAEYSSVAEASVKTGISKTCISRCCRGERDKSGGFRWYYLD
ncbi:NUMOD1 domain-containing protein [Muriicola jejuensis]|uniref:GIY-YIG nuclease family protein n=1 Tax=Muriicola jejuensis TaxID=504488 RepID=A0A6P0UC21_9FLAO|nr:NUMOD1 domain-containing DNA-binding protein [Muriicola jejuensis]NER10040.1 GIY-YIG nuclease family protein [Muriicola jejuensis]SMP03501.1 NUMOD1 domain-containing protein [Muriicola jejuensis]